MQQLSFQYIDAVVCATGRAFSLWNVLLRHSQMFLFMWISLLIICLTRLYVISYKQHQTSNAASSTFAVAYSQLETVCSSQIRRRLYMLLAAEKTLDSVVIVGTVSETISFLAVCSARVQWSEGVHLCMSSVLRRSQLEVCILLFLAQ